MGVLDSANEVAEFLATCTLHSQLMGASVTASVVHVAGTRQQASTANPVLCMFDPDNELAEFQSPKQRL